MLSTARKTLASSRGTGKGPSLARTGNGPSPGAPSAAEMLVQTFGGGRPRTAVVSGIALVHSAAPMGEAQTVRAAGGFGLDI